MSVEQALAGQRPTWVEIDLDRLVGNYRAVSDHLPPGVTVMAVVKADAYGHGAPRVASALQEAGSKTFGVAITEEAVTLRNAGVSGAILVFGGCFPGQEETFVELGLTPTIYDMDAVRRLSEVAISRDQVVGYHLKLDTGMGRLGIGPDDVAGFVERAASYKGARLEGIFSHLSSADEDDLTYTKQQIRIYTEAVDGIEAAGHHHIVRHVANSAGTLLHSGSWFDMVRAGLSLYGIHPSRHRGAVELSPVMSFKTRIAFVKTVPVGTALGYNRTFKTDRPSLIATLPVGYADGLARLTSNKGHVLVAGEQAPIVGNVSMDTTLVDVTEIPGVGPGEEVVLIGTQGDARISAREAGRWASTIPYEVVCRISRRVPRLYLSAGESGELEVENYRGDTES
jgi:alanine racemase